MTPFSRALARRALREARRLVRTTLGRTTVETPAPRMFPGALRLAQEEEDAAAEAARAVVRSKRLFRHFGVARNPLEPSRVAKFERAFARRVDASHALAVNSGTSALVCALVGLGVGPEDEVIVPAYTWVSTASAVLAVGAVPVIAEVDASLTLDPEDVERRIGPHTRALIPVHMRGAPADMEAMLRIGERHGVAVLEDVAQAAGASFRGRPLGSLGDAGAFSFHQTKIITTGEGGMLTTRHASVARRATMYHDCAVVPHRGVALDDWLPGVNLRMSELHAALGLVQLERLDGLLARMRANKARLLGLLGDALSSPGIRRRELNDPDGDAGTALVFFLDAPEKTPALVEALCDENVPASRLYHDGERLPHDHVDLHAAAAWTPILRRRAWTERGGPWRRHPREVEYGEFPRTLELLRRAVHVDVSPDLSPREIEQMARAIRRAIAGRA